MPVIPEWVSRQGLLKDVKVEKSSGYSDVDAAVLDAVRRWKFKAISGGRDVRGRVPYLITPR